MKPAINLLIITTTLASLVIAIPVKADSVAARCAIYPKGQKQPSASAPCVFSQRQGYVSIQLQNGKRYDLKPVGDQPGNYIDQQGQAAYRQAGLGDRGHIYKMSTESVYVYWDAAASLPSNPPTSTKRGISTLRASQANDRINVRSQPTFNSSTPHYGLPGDKVEVIRCVQDTDTPGSDLNWCNVRFVQSQATGWIRSDFIIFADGGE